LEIKCKKEEKANPKVALGVKKWWKIKRFANSVLPKGGPFSKGEFREGLGKLRLTNKEEVYSSK